jgi:hypothetical protein
MKSTWILTAAIGAAVCFGFAQQANKQVTQQTSKPTSKKAELERVFVFLIIRQMQYTARI